MGAVSDVTIEVEVHQRASLAIRSSDNDNTTLARYREQILDTRSQLARQVAEQQDLEQKEKEPQV